ncbi:hypothetical protein [Xanthobacter versatilis]|uniref:hypothetical protein n=1 Tax=Xanthobacter autotrophicus (strain ATCC BAA-1158 / Py2) TaxID=78245 RepID=UPI00372C6099
METFRLILDWAYKFMATWYVAGILGGVLILIAERFDRCKEPADEDVRRVAELYRQYYGAYASQVVGDHMLGASFGPDGRHHAFLKRVSAELLASLATDEDRVHAIES